MNRMYSALLAMVLGAASTGWAQGGPPAQTGQPAQSVTVVNGTSNPVPVTGNVGVTGVVTVGNAPSSPVPISGTVNVGNSPSVTVTNFPATHAEPGRTPYQQSILFNQNNPSLCTQFVCIIQFNPVPAGMRLVVTYASGRFALVAPSASQYIALGVDGNIFGTQLDLSVVDSGNGYMLGSHAVQFFVEAGHRPTVFISGNSVFTSNTGNAGLVGYLIPAP